MAGGTFGRSLSGLSGASGASGGKTRFNTPEDEARVKIVFDALDADGSGTLERSEILSAISALGIPLQNSSAIEELCGGGARADHAALNFEKFAKLALASDVEDLHLDECVKLFMSLDRETQAHSAIESQGKAYDTENKARIKNFGGNKGPKIAPYAEKGALSWKDLKHLAHELGEEIDDEQLREMCRVLDRDGDGMLGPDDFYGAIASATQLQHIHGYSALVKAASGNVHKPGSALRDMFGTTGYSNYEKSIRGGGSQAGDLRSNPGHRTGGSNF
jgi:Ca2+-binding EF-hand superfamily protein